MTEHLPRLRALLAQSPELPLTDDVQARTEVYRVLAENSAAFVTLADANGILRWASPSATRALGWDPDTAVGRPTMSFLHPDDIPKLIALRAQMTEEEAQVICCRVQAADGSYRWFDLAIKPVFDADGTLLARVTAYQDVEDRVAAEAALVASEEKFRLLAENATDVIIHARDTVPVWVSPSLTEALGWAPEDWVGGDVLSFVHPDDREAARPVDVQTSTSATRLRLRIQDAAGAYHWIESRSRAHLDAAGQPDGWISSFRVIDDIVLAETELDQRARFDTLTGLMNRTEVLGRMERITAHRPRTGAETAVLFCDIDLFKEVNDTLGHAAGDEVLRVLAERVRSSVRADDFAARIGGDELLVMLNGVHGLEESHGIAEKIRVAAEEPIPFGDHVIRTTLSIGVTLARHDETTDVLMARADRAMYAAKAKGRNQVIAL